jgi:hypothetical protein
MQQGKQQPQHQPADGPAFWNITHNFKPGELESDLSKMFFNQALDLHKENEALKQHIKRLEDIIEKASKHFRSAGPNAFTAREMADVLKEAKP